MRNSSFLPPPKVVHEIDRICLCFLVFPPLWFLSFFILLSPLTAPAEWESTTTAAEREALLDAIRKAEAKWARRSIAAAAILSILIVILVVIVVSVSHS